MSLMLRSVVVVLVVCSSACATLQGLSSKVPAPVPDVGQATALVPAGAQASTIEQNLVRQLGAEAVFSASAVQGTPSPLCDVGDQVGVTVLELDAQRRLDCFAFRKGDLRPASFVSLRDYQDHGAIHRARVPAVPGPEKPVHVNVQTNGGTTALQIVTQGEQLVIALVPLTEKAKGLDNGFVLAWADALQLLDTANAKVDVLVKDAAKAKTVDLAAEKARVLAAGLAELPRLRAEKAKADAEALEKVRFPVAVAGADAARAAKSLQAYLEKESKAGIAAASVKKTALTSEWKVAKSPLGFVMSRSADVTVGFARTDAYAIDPNSQCAFATFEVKSEFDPRANAYEAPAATGLASGWTNIRCDRLR